MKKVILSAAATVGIAVASTTIADAGVQYVGGGKWEYGTSDTKVWSDYYHKDDRHGSSVEGRNGLTQSDCVNGGIWSRASDTKPRFGTGKSYWRKC